MDTISGASFNDESFVRSFFSVGEVTTFRKAASTMIVTSARGRQ
jgi:hypothetical protein